MDTLRRLLCGREATAPHIVNWADETNDAMTTSDFTTSERASVIVNTVSRPRRKSQLVRSSASPPHVTYHHDCLIDLLYRVSFLFL